MKQKNYFLLFPFLIALFLSCEGNTIDSAIGSRAIFVTAAIDAQQTRATDVAWEKNDAIGIYMKKSGEMLHSSPLAQNKRYITNGNSLFTPENEAAQILFPFNGSDVDFIAYYPHRKTITDFSYPVDVTKQSNLAAIDLLYSTNAEKLNSRNPNVNMLFSHQLSKVILRIQSSSPKLNLSGLAVKITNSGTAASFSLSEGKLGDPSSTGDIFFRVNANGTLAEAILLPTENLTGKKLIFMAGNTWFTYDLSSSSTITSFAKSTKYTYSITLNPEIVNANVEGSIADWINGANEEAVIGHDPYDGKGTREDPYTVEEALEYQGKTNVWVKAVIVGYKSGSSYIFSSEGAPSTQIAIASNKDVNTPANIMPAQLPMGQVRDIINLKDNPTMLHKEVFLKGDLDEYLGVFGLKNVKTAIVDGTEYPNP